MNSAILLIAVNAFVFLVNLVLHGSSYTGVNAQDDWPAVLVLDVIALIALAAYTFLRLVRTADPRTWTEDLIPQQIGAFGGMLFVYAAVLFFILLVNEKSGQPAIVDGSFALVSKSHQVIRFLTADEWTRMRRDEIRFFSSFLLLLSWTSLGMAVVRLRLLARQPRREPQPEP